MVKSIYPGTFDPVTKGHFDIVQRASLLFEKVTVCVYSGSLKNVIFDIDERVSMFQQAVSDLNNVDVIPFNTLTVDLAKELNSSACLLYTSDAADDMQCVDLGGRRII